MRITIFGASGGVGKHVVDLALARGHTVRAVYRSPSTRPLAERFAPVVIPDLLADGALAEVVRTSDAVISALGLRRVHPWNPFSGLASPPDFTSRFARRLVDVLHDQRGPRRVVAVSAAGVGDSWQGVSPPLRALFRSSNIGVAYRDLDHMEAILRESTHDWTCVRPTTLTNGPLTKEICVTGRYTFVSRISRADVAWYLLQSLERLNDPQRTPMITSA